ncbi:hypothetical protein CRG98_020481 [Punica granatum]|uniref:Uncharacterized protein n=1 Tax=Punica granatum TaxID=22663 RepID=A0A2I0JS34_PUNGR|nr:hypothetical protein CRG98_020481 [Punica granatum]
MVSERVMLPRTHVGSHHARFDFEVAKSAPPVNQAQEWSGSVPRPKWVFYMVSERVMLPRTHVGSHHARFDFEMGSSPCRPKWVFYMVSERVMLPRTHVGSHHARFDFEVAKSAPPVNQAQEWSGSVPRWAQVRVGPSGYFTSST